MLTLSTNDLSGNRPIHSIFLAIDFVSMQRVFTVKGHTPPQVRWREIGMSINRAISEKGFKSPSAQKTGCECETSELGACMARGSKNSAAINRT